MVEPDSVLSIRNRAWRLVQHFEPMKAFPLSLAAGDDVGHAVAFEVEARDWVNILGVGPFSPV
jgi:hypothetical protein